jgi:hypothetical protein
MIEDFLRRVIAGLESTGIPYMLTGSLASSVHGIPRSTNDIDLVIAPSRNQLLSFVQLFERAGLYVTWEEASRALARRDQFNVVDIRNGWKADLILIKERAFSTGEFNRREPAEVEGIPLMIATPEDVLLSKLEWAKIGGSERQIADAAGILTMQGAQLDLAYVERWVVELGLQAEWAAARGMQL